MRLSELLDAEVVDSDGQSIGGLADVVLAQDGPMLGPHAASFRVAGVVVVEHRHTHLLGYERDLRPAVFRVAMHAMTGEVWQVPWDQLDEVSPQRVTLRLRRSDLAGHDRSARA